MTCCLGKVDAIPGELGAVLLALVVLLVHMIAVAHQKLSTCNNE